MLKAQIVFFIGTEAELIKIFPIMMEVRKRGMPIKIIASGQNDIKCSQVLLEANYGYVDLELSDANRIIKSSFGLLRWFLSTIWKAKKKIQRQFPDIDWQQSIIIIHGDTISTVMGAYIGKKLRATVAHIEAGLRSHHYFNPFPEEIDRLLASRWAKIHFAPGEDAVKNLSSVKGTVIDTIHNTVLDGLRYSHQIHIENDFIQKLSEKSYFVLVLHRQENLMREDFVIGVIRRIINLSKDIVCIFVLHEITEKAIRSIGLWDAIVAEQNILTLERMPYFDFMKLLTRAEYVITDGGSNQEELNYMGKPTLILRRATERRHGLGTNAVMYGGKISMISTFAKEYKKYRHEPPAIDVSPSMLICDWLEKNWRKFPK